MWVGLYERLFVSNVVEEQVITDGDFKDEIQNFFLTANKVIASQ